MSVRIIVGDCRDKLRLLPENSVQCCVTSPPYFGLRDYGMEAQIGLEPTPDEFVAAMVGVFREVRRVLRDDGTLWLNLGDSYGSKKQLLGMPWRVAFALQADEWVLRSSIIWHKPNPMPESVTDRPTSAHENIFLFAKSDRYFYDAEAIKEAEAVPDWDDGSRTFGGVNKHGANVAHGHRTTGRVAGPRKRGVPPKHQAYASSDQSGLDDVGRGKGRNKRNVWTIATKPFTEAHFATFPPDLIEPCVRAGCPKGGTVLDPFGGAGTTALVADRLERNAILIELNPDYAAMAERRIRSEQPMFADVILDAAE